MRPLALVMVLLHLFLLFLPTPSARFFLCVMTKVKAMTPSSGCNVLEWLEYHLALGVDHFWVTDDCSRTPGNLLPLLSHYQTLGRVTLVTPYTRPQDCADYRPNEGATYRRMFFANRAREQCEWIVNLDYDEYVTFWAWGDVLHNNSLPHYLAAHAFSFLRLPWWVLGNQGHEAKPRGLVLESYTAGSLERPRYVKTIARVSDIVNFQSPHLPQPSPSLSNVSLLSTSRHPARALPPGVPRDPNMTVLRYTAWNTLHDEEKTLATLPLLPTRALAPSAPSAPPAPSTIVLPVPATEIFLKHYKYLSWEEFVKQRAATPTLPNGRTNYWSLDARAVWERGNSSVARARARAKAKPKQTQGGRKKKRASEEAAAAAAAGQEGQEGEDGREGNVNVAEGFTAHMALWLRRRIIERVGAMRLDAARGGALEAVRRDCLPYWPFVQVDGTAAA